ncbi:MAG TPA: lysophospholipid acyltransferase family protein [Planctomycetaceae bacterium]|nr:lysophospholipid acyltransferase family protein [Planctomycetaceae bacterium]
MKSARTLRHLIEYVAFRLVVCLVAALPTRTSVRLANGLAFVVHRLLPGRLTRYHVARENLRIAFGGQLDEARIDRAIHGMWQHLFRMVVEIIQLPRKMRLYNLSQFMSFRQRDESTRALSCGRPVIVLSGHFGNWEVANATFGHFGFPLGVVARDLDNPFLHRWFERFRRHTGHRLISKKGGGGELITAMDRRAAVAMLCDQDAGSRGLFVPFFGREASTFKSIALLALEYRAVVVVGYVRRLPDDFENCRWVRFEMGCEEVLDPDDLAGRDPVRELTLRYTQALERMVRLAPEQYFWVHRRWKSQPQPRRRARAA